MLYLDEVGQLRPHLAGYEEQQYGRGVSKTSTYTVAAVDASLFADSLVTPTITPRIVQRKMLTKLSAGVDYGCLRKTHLESWFGSASIGQGFILNVFTLSMKSNLTSHLLSIVALVPSFCRKMSLRNR